nr:protein FAR1-RELATED SEQUENCE 5-like [Arachis hypogaea]
MTRRNSDDEEEGGGEDERQGGRRELLTGGFMSQPPVLFRQRILVVDHVMVWAHSVAIRKVVYAGTQPHSRSATFTAVRVAIDVEAAFDLRQCCRFEMESYGEGSSDFSVQWTDGWSMDSTDDDEGSAARSPEIEEGQSAARDREDGSVAGDEGSMLVPTGIHVVADNPYSDEELGSAVLTAAALESAEYNSVEEAYKAYVAFANATGFAVRKGDSVKNEEENIVQKFFYCNRQSLHEKKHYERVDRKRAHKAETRTNCYAKYVVYLDMSSRKWRIKTLIVDHNHDLAPPDFTNVMAPHRKLTDGDKAHIHSVHEAGFQTTQIIGFFAHLCGGYRNVNFIRKDLYNYMDDVRQSRIVEGDAAAAISYLKGKTEMDPLAVVKYSYCAEKHLGNIFWSDGYMQYDYECFGDVLAFDSTYKKNLYNRPLVIFSGTNHHRQIIMFGFGLLDDEKIPSYKWLLGCFLEVMQSKEPKVVVTDGDESMKEAIRSEFPNTTHQLYSWHLARNALQKIKDSDFCAAFKKAVYDHFDVKDFEDYWVEVVRSFGLDFERRKYRSRHHDKDGDEITLSACRASSALKRV